MDDIEAFKAALKEHDSSYIYRKYLLGHDVWYFREKLSLKEHAHKYDDFKIYMSQKLGIHINNIAIVGSAKLGFSITPRKEKAFSVFSDESDIDIVVVSSDIFKSSWLAYLELSGKKKIPGYTGITKNIFRRFVSLKNVDSSNEFFLHWQGKMEPCQKDLQVMYSVPNEINYRIYESWEDVERYHLKGLEELKLLLEENP